MSLVPNSAVEAESVASNVAKPEQMLAGFPWVSAIVLYTLSWGWSLLRPNTLYWDDWLIYFNQPSGNGLSANAAMGRPPWGNLIEFLLMELGTWVVTVTTFLIFMLTAAIVFCILCKQQLFDSDQSRWIVLIFLLIPVNHARVAVSIFDYTTSYFLFYLGWFLLVRFKSAKSFVLACVILFLSFKTHSFLFFVLLPFLHFGWLNRARLLDLKKLSLFHFQVSVIAVLPVLYVISRSVFWPPSESWQDYQQPT